MVMTGTEQWRSALLDVQSIAAKSSVIGSILRASFGSKRTAGPSRVSLDSSSSATVTSACEASTESGKSKSEREKTALLVSERQTEATK